jgi:hypothetical protein
MKAHPWKISQSDELLQFGTTAAANRRSLIRWLRGRQRCSPQNQEPEKHSKPTMILPSCCILTHNPQASKMLRVNPGRSRLRMGFNTVLSPSLQPPVARRNTSAKNTLDRIGYYATRCASSLRSLRDCCAITESLESYLPRHKREKNSHRIRGRRKTSSTQTPTAKP